MSKKILLIILFAFSLFLAGCNGTYNFSENEINSGINYSGDVVTDKGSVHENVGMNNENSNYSLKIMIHNLL